MGEQLRVRVVPTDADGNVPGLSLLNYPDGAIFSDNGDGTRTFAWTPSETFVGEHEFVFEAFDATDVSLVSSRTLRVSVVDADGGENPNFPPEFESLNDQQIMLGDSFSFRVVPIDPEGVVPSLVVDRLPDGATFDDNGDGTRQFSWAPTAGDLGVTELIFTTLDADDSSLTTSQKITLTIVDDEGQPLPGADIAPDLENTAPILTGLSDSEVSLGESFELRVLPFDIDGDVPGLAVDRLPGNASFSDNFDGSRTFRWFPQPINVGDTFITFTAIDAQHPTVRTRQTVRLSVSVDPNNPVNFEPTINGIRNPLIRAGDTLNLKVQPVDPDFTVPALQVIHPPAGSSFPDNGDGTRTLVWPTSEEDIGQRSLEFLATDSVDPLLTFERTVYVEVVEPEFVDRAGSRLRDLADKRDFKIGFAAALQSATLADNELYRDIAAEEFNILTPENSHKMGWIHPVRGEFRFEDADDLADYSEQHGMDLHGHPLVWFAQLPSWVLQLDPVDAQEVMIEHINAVAGRYKGRVAVWDVVNEALEENGTLRNSIWYQGMGEDYIRLAFEASRQADPDAVLIYNDFDVAWENAKSDAMYELMKRELAAGTPIDGVGFQMHLRSGFDDFESVQRNFDRFAALGLQIYITEFDVALDAPDTLEQQAAIYQKSLEICLAMSSCKAMQAWGFTDRYSWRSAYTPLLLDTDYQVKPAYKAWQRTLMDFQ
ncbi:MAG: endo-1,4-beta-xylanase [Granulosicoccus sp.]